MAAVLKLVKGLRLILDMVDKDSAIGMVNFVLKDARQEAFGGYAHFFAVQAEGFDADFSVAWNLAVDITNAQAAFEVFFDGAFVFGDLWVDKNGKRAVVLVIEIVTYYDDTVHLVDLHGSQSDADLMVARGFPVEGSRLHVVDDLFDLWRDQTNLLRTLSQAGVWQGDDIFFFHSVSILEIGGQEKSLL